MPTDANMWKRCSSCKSEIPFSTTFWVCSVSTCNRKRTGLVFCSVACWEMHLPLMRHREAYAVEERSPSRERWLREQAEEEAAASTAPSSVGAGNPSTGASNNALNNASASASGSAGVVARRRVVAPAADAAENHDEDDGDIDRDILIVVSKLKKYVRTRSGMNTSDAVMSLLSDHVRAVCNEAIRNAAQDGRKTVLERDIPPIGATTRDRDD